MPAALLDDLLEWLRIPSISTGEGEAADLVRAAEWAADRVRGAGGTCDLVSLDGSAPLVIGELRAASGDAPTVLIYGHYDVQGPGDPALWTTPAFEPDVRDGRVFARGAADDKGNFLPLLRAACDLAGTGALPVHVRVLVEGEEEVGSAACLRWLAEDARGADAAIVMDSGMVDPQTPAVTVGLRGIVMGTVRVRTGARDIHSGLYGGAALNAVHALHTVLTAVLPDAEGRVREELRAGLEPPARREIESWQRLPPGPAVLAEVGAPEVTAGAAEAFYSRTGAEPSLDVNAIEAGAFRTIVPATASATLSLRLAPRQDPDALRQTLERLMREAAPAGAEIAFDHWHTAEPALFPVDDPVIALGAQALERAVGAPAAFTRSGGSIPVVAGLAARGIPAIVTGFVLPDDPFHAPDESFSLRGLELGERAGRELLHGLAALR